jgi:hypothetical protein
VAPVSEIRKFVKPPGFLYYLMTSNGAIAKIRLSDGNAYGKKRFGLGDGHGLASDQNGNVYETTFNGKDSRLIELDGHKLKISRTISMESGNALAVAVDQEGLSYVAWFGDSGHDMAIKVFSSSASGNATPIRTISGSQTGLEGPEAIVVDARGSTYVADAVADKILVFPPGANGNIAPIQVIGGAQTGISLPVNLTLGGDGNIYVCNQLPGNSGGYDILAYPFDATGNVAPVRVLQTGAYGYAIVLDTAGELYAGEGFEGGPFQPTFEVYAAGASGNDQPIGYLDGVYGATPFRAVLQFPWYRL